MVMWKLFLGLISILYFASSLSADQEVVDPADITPILLPMWRNEIIAPGAVSQSALALDSARVPHILYHNTAAQDLYWAYADGDGWQRERVATVSPEGLDVAIALDAQDRPYVAYVDGAADKLVLGTRQGSKWSLEPIAAGGEQLSLAVGSDGIPQLILVRDKRLYYLRLQGEEWLSELVGQGKYGLWNARLVLDSEDRAHVAFTTNLESIYALRQGTNDWLSESLSFFLVEDLVIGPGDKVNILYRDLRYEGDGKYPTEYYELYLAERFNNGWYEELVFELASSFDNARLAFGPDGMMHAVVRDGGICSYLYFGWGTFEWPVESCPSTGDASLVVMENGEPLLLTHNDGDLILSVREIVRLDKHSLMPLVAGNG